MRITPVLLALVIGTTVATAFELKPVTLAGYDRYIALTEARLASERAGTVPLFWLDRQPAAERTRLMAQLQQGEVVLAKLDTRDRGAEVRICLLYTSDAADDTPCVDLGGRRIIKKKFFSSRRRHTR